MYQNNNHPQVVAFGEMAMEELGLYADPNGRILDQQTDELLQIKGKTLKFVNDPAIRLERGEMEFDPLNNQTLANNLFGFYIDRRYNESGDRYVSNYATVADQQNKNMGVLQVKSEEGTIVSNPYYMDSLKYMDMIKRMNGEEANLAEFDKEPATRKPRKK